MSKVSAKSRYTQLMEWLRTYPPSPKYKDKDKDSKNSRKQSRMTYYKKKGFNR